MWHRFFCPCCRPKQKRTPVEVISGADAPEEISVFSGGALRENEASGSAAPNIDMPAQLAGYLMQYAAILQQRKDPTKPLSRADRKALGDAPCLFVQALQVEHVQPLVEKLPRATIANFGVKIFSEFIKLGEKASGMSLDERTRRALRSYLVGCPKKKTRFEVRERARPLFYQAEKIYGTFEAPPQPKPRRRHHHQALPITSLPEESRHPSLVEEAVDSVRSPSPSSSM